MKDTRFAHRQVTRIGRLVWSADLKAVSIFTLRAWCASALVVMGATVQAASITWDGGTGGTGTSWNDATNWGGDVLPGASDTVQFTSTGLPASTVISLGASQAIRELRINSYSNAPTFTIGSAADITAGYTLTLTNVYRGDNNGNTQTVAANVNLAGDSVWNIINGYSGSVSVTGAIGSASDVILTKEGSNTLTLSGANTFTGGVRSVGGTLLLSNNANAYTGTTAATGGNVALSFGAATTTNIINSASALELGGIRGGGGLTVNGRNSANVVNSQTFNGLTLNTGASSLSIVNGIASGKTLVALGAITRNTGGTVNFTQPTVNTTISAQNGYTTSTANDASGIIGPWATVGGTEYAANNGTNIVAYTGYTDQADNVLADGSTTNVRITSGTTGDITQNAGTTTVNTLRVNDAAARLVTVGAGNTLRTNGILATGTNGLTIGAVGDAGSVTAGSADNTAGELILNNTTALTVNSVVADNGTGAVSLTKSGAGTATLAATNTYTGTTTVNAGTLAVTAGSTNPLSTVGAITVNAGTLNLGSATSQTTSGAVVIAGGTLSNGTLTKSGANYDVRGGTISTKLAGSVGLDKTTSGILTFANTVANTYTGTTTISEGSVIGSATNVVSISGNLVVGSASGGNAASFSGNGNNTNNFDGTKSITIYSNGSVSFGGGSSQATSAVTILGGTFSGQVYQGATVNMTGGTWSATSYGNVQSFTSSASSSTAVVSGYLAGSQATRTFTVADGAAAIDLLFSGGTASNTNNLTKAGAGFMSMTGTKAYTGNTTLSGGTLAAAVLADGGVISSIGASSNAATNLRLGNGTTFEYAGSGHSTDRLFTVNGTVAGDSATLNASGTGAASFTNTGSLAWGTNNQTRTLKLGGTNIADNTLAAVIANNGTGAVSLTKQDAGRWLLSGANTFTGATTVNGGTLALGANNAFSSGSALVLSSGVIDLQSFSSSAASLSFSAANTLKFNLGAPGNGTALLALTGSLSKSGSGVFTLDFSGTGSAGTYNLVSFAGTTFADQSEFTVANLGSGLTGALTLNASMLSLTVSAVPEPSACAALGGVLALGFAVCRRRRRA